jgi:uncharacterized protein (DUF362 family)
MNRRQFCRQLAAVCGAAVCGAAAAAPLLNACRGARPAPQRALGGLKPTPGFDSPAALPPATLPPPTAAPPAITLPAITLPATTPPDVPTPDPTAAPTITPGAGGALIAIVHTTDRAAGVRRALDLLGLNPVNGRRVLLKPNFNSADPAPAATHPDVLRALLLALTDMGARAVTLGERSGMGVTRRVLQQMGVFDLAAEFGADAVVFDELDGGDWVVRGDSDFHWANGFAVPRLLLDSECVVQTCNLKTHRYGGHFTMTLKNSVGFVATTAGSSAHNYMHELHNSPHQRAMIAEINRAYTPALLLMDGVDAFVDGGPAVGTLARPELILAGTDRVAMDAVGVAILRLFGATPEVSQGPIFAQEQIARAVELGLGVNSPAGIHLLAADPAGQAYADRIQQMLLAV